MLPAPAAVQAPPPAPAQVHTAPVSAAGTGSDIVAPVTAVGPALLATIVYVTACPAETVVWPSVFVIDRSAAGMIVSVSVALLFVRFGSVIPPGVATVAVFDSVPVAVTSRLPVARNVTVLPDRRSTDRLMFPEPLLAPQLAPAEATQLQLSPPRTAGNVSVTIAPTAESGPSLVTVIVYVTGFPATAVAWPSVLVIDRSARFEPILATKASSIPPLTPWRGFAVGKLGEFVPPVT